MRFVVTGAAGFIGSNLCDQLVRDGHSVVGIDRFDDYYSPRAKERNVRDLESNTNFQLIRGDLNNMTLDSVIRGAECVLNLAGAPGLLQSWADFDRYVSANINATQRLIQGVLRCGIPRLVHVSTSSVYGRNAIGDENEPTEPISPYGVTKLAGENLVHAYTASYGLSAVILRYFSVYGPRQRPDMAYNIFISRVLNSEPITIFGDGKQSRSSTFVGDCVRGTIQAALSAPSGQTFNIGGGEVVTLESILNMIFELTGQKVAVTYGPKRPGDQVHTAADFSAAARSFGYVSSTSLHDGLSAQVRWQREMLREGGECESF